MDSNHPYLSVIRLDSTINKDGNCYPQLFSKKWKYIKEVLIKYVAKDIFF